MDLNKKPECHYYIADYQGPRSNKEGLIILREKTNIYVRGNRMVVNAHTNEVEQTTHYYPYGGIIGNLSSNQEAQKYKYSNKELDRTYGLDLYDFQARLFNPALPVFDRPDPLAEKYYSISPYAYCAGDPVNCVDPDGKKVVFNTYKGQNIELEKQFNQAREYLQSIGASEYLDRIVNDKNFVVMISLPTKTGENEYKNRKEGLGQGNWNEGVIYWDPSIAKETDNGYVISPVEGLNHEANHAINDLGGDEEQHKQFMERSQKGTDKDWCNPEEKQVCSNENKLAKKMGKLNKEHPTTRTQYYVREKKFYRVNSITSSSTTNPIIK